MTIFEELAWAETHEGLLTLRRRTEPTRGVEVYEVKIGDEFLMSSLFTVAEIELARLGLAAVPGDGDLDVVVGGLGLGYTAVAALEDSRVRSLIVVEAFAEVIDWHERRLLPDAEGLADDDRVRFRQADFFEVVRDGDGFDPARPGGKVHAVLLDIDHTPRHILHDSHADFYTQDGLARLADNLHPGGVFALWSDDPPDEAFEAALSSVFAESESHVVTFPNFQTGSESSNTVYVSRTPTR